METILDKLFKDKQGKWAVVSAPNLPLVVWFVATIGAKIFNHGGLHAVLSAASFGALIFWAVLEITSGVNYFRRVLGLVVLIFTLYSHLN